MLHRIISSRVAAHEPKGINVTDGEPSRFTLAELVEASGVSERRIRFYISNNLVSPAYGRGRSRYFTSQHLAELEWVASQRSKRYSIDEIRQQIAEDTVPEPEESGEIWERIHLHPGLELSVRADAPDGTRALAKELQRAARDWFGDTATNTSDE